MESFLTTTSVAVSSDHDAADELGLLELDDFHDEDFSHASRKRKLVLPIRVVPQLYLQGGFGLVVLCMMVWTGLYFFCPYENSFCIGFHDKVVDNIAHRFYDDYRGEFIVGFVIPFLFIACLSTLILVLLEPERPNVIIAQEGHHHTSHFWTRLTHGDYPSQFLAIILLVLPSFLYVGFVYFESTDQYKLRYSADAAGWVATCMLGWFMVPVARQSPILVALGWHPVHALQIHIWAGRVCIWMGLYHSATYIYHFYLSLTVVEQMFPPIECWGWYAPSDYHRDGVLWSTTCYRTWFNFTGFVSGVFLLLLSFTAYSCVRRRYYRLFYWTHVIFGSLAVIFLVLHWHYSVWIIGPSFLYYMLSTFPTLVQALTAYFQHGYKVLRISILPDAGYVAEVILDKDKKARRIEMETSNQYVRICVPELSLMWYPFTVATATPKDDDDQFRLLFRRYGFFTTKFYKRLLQKGKDPPKILVDAYYHGPNWVAQALRHDRIVMMAGGIAITPFLSTLSQMATILASTTKNASTKKISFHWVCRDRGLVDHIITEHFLPMMLEGSSESNVLSEGGKSHIDIILHLTGGASKKTLVDYIASSSSSSLLEEVESHDDTEDSAQRTFGSVMLQESDDTIEPTKKIVTNFPNGKGVKLEPAHFGTDPRGFSALPIFGMHMIGSWAGVRILYVIHKYHIATRLVAPDGYPLYALVTPNGYPLYALVAWALGLALVGELIYRVVVVMMACNDNSGYRPVEGTKQCNERMVPSKEMHVVNNVNSRAVEGTQSRFFELSNGIARGEMVGTDVLSMRMTLKTGRPDDLDSLAGWLMEGEAPATFYCGPAMLKGALYESIRKQEDKCMGGCLASWRCGFYEEKFEM